MSGFRIPTGEHQIVRPTNGETHDEPLVVERREDGVRIPSKLLWPLVALVLGGSGSGVAAVLGLGPGQAAPPVADERMATTVQRVTAIEAELGRMRTTAERTERNLVRVAERLRIRDVERP